MKKSIILSLCLAFIVAAVYIMVAGCGSAATSGGSSTGATIAKIYLANKSLGGFFVYNPETNTTEAQVTLEAGTTVYGLGITPDKKYLFALAYKYGGGPSSTATSEMFKYNISTEAIASHSFTFADSKEAFGSYILGFKSDSSNVYVASRGIAGIYAINTSTWATDADVTYGGTCDAMSSGVVASDGRVYFGNHHPSAEALVYRYDPSTSSIDATVDLVHGVVNRIRINPAGTKLYAAMDNTPTTDYVYVIDLASFTQDTGSTVTGGNYCRDLGFSANGEGYIANYGSDNATAFTISGSYFASTIALKTGMGPANVIIDDGRSRAYVNGYVLSRIATINLVNDSSSDLLDCVIPNADGTDQAAYINN
jgi:hypothetical protein